MNARWGTLARDPLHIAAEVLAAFEHPPPLAAFEHRPRRARDIEFLVRPVAAFEHRVTEIPSCGVVGWGHV